MKKAKESEFGRSLFHIASGLTIVLIYGLTKIARNHALMILGGIALFFLLGDIFRHFIPALAEVTARVFGVIMREKERKRPAASSYYVAGCWIAIFLFSREVACICILHLVVCDSLAKVLRKFSLHQRSFLHKLKIISANFLASFLISLFVLKATSTTYLLFPSLLGAVGATLGELVPEVDNFTIPIFSGILLTAGLFLVS
ncbi:hypothetical protein H5U35_01305 [Candidatus Aerophobetes bacterium]|nr:hypothetical protein [Candidatus Aerophobetes bacterium]